MVNEHKSAVYFSPNTDEYVKCVVHDRLNIPNEALGEKYLGLPTTVGRSMNVGFLLHRG